MNEDAEIHAVYRGVSALITHLAAKVFRVLHQMSLLDGVQGALEPIDYFGLGGDGAFGVIFKVWRHLGSGDAQQIEVCYDDMHVNFAGRTHSRSRPPRELLGRRSFGQRDQLLRYMSPLAI